MAELAASLSRPKRLELGDRNLPVAGHCRYERLECRQEDVRRVDAPTRGEMLGRVVEMAARDLRPGQHEIASRVGREPADDVVRGIGGIVEASGEVENQCQGVARNARRGGGRRGFPGPV
jgi:hypothetical protein